MHHRIARCVDIDHDIGAFAPLFRHRERDRGSRRLNLAGLDGEDAIGGDDDLCFAVIRRHDGQSGWTTRNDLLLVDSDFDPVWRFNAVARDVSAPTDAERAARDAAIFGFDDELMLAPIETRHSQHTRPILRAQSTLIDGPNRARASPFPTAVFAVPVIVIIDLEDLPAQVLDHAFAACIHGCDLEATFFLIGNSAVETWLDAEVKIFGAIRNADAFSDRSATGLEHTYNRIQAQRHISIASPVSRREANGGLACPICDAILQIDDLLAEAAIMWPPAEALIAKRLRIDFDARLGRDCQRCARRAIEEACSNFHIARIISGQERGIFSFQLDSDALRDKILN